MNSGISSRHGAHQVAQKLTTTTLPRHWSRRCSLPAGSGRASPQRAAARRRRTEAKAPASAARPRWRSRSPRRSAPAAATPTAASSEFRRASVEPALLAGDRPRPPGRAPSRLSARERDLLSGSRVAHAGVRAPCESADQHDGLPAGGSRSGTRTTTSPRYVSTLPKNWSSFTLPGGSRDGELGHVRLERELHLVAVQVIAVGHAKRASSVRLVERARGEAECLLRRQELGIAWAPQSPATHGQRRRRRR